MQILNHLVNLNYSRWFLIFPPISNTHLKLSFYSVANILLRMPSLRFRSVTQPILSKTKIWLLFPIPLVNLNYSKLFLISPPISNTELKLSFFTITNILLRMPSLRFLSVTQPIIIITKFWKLILNRLVNFNYSKWFLIYTPISNTDLKLDFISK
jgi:hypothetical protein